MTRRILSFLTFLVVFLGTSLGMQSDVNASTAYGAMEDISAQRIIKESTLRDPEGMQRKISILYSNEALMELFAGYQDRNSVDVYIKFYAAITDDNHIQKFVDNTRNKRFNISPDKNGVISSGSIHLVEESEGKVTHLQGLNCGKAWAASYGYFLATEMTCTAVGLMGFGIAGFGCAAVFLAISNLPGFDFNNACRR